MNIHFLYDKIFTCNKCTISRCEFNVVRSLYGGEISNIIYFWIGQNPGISLNKKWGDIVFPITGNNNKNQDEFTTFLYKQQIYQKSYFTNTIKCSTPQNRIPNDEEIINCFSFLHKELILVKPKCIITMGRISKEVLEKVYTITDEFKNVKLFNIYHPTYIYSYNRNKMQTYQDNILNIKREIENG